MSLSAHQKTQDGLKVRGVDPEGIGAAVGILPGDVVERINGEVLRDPIDYRFHVSDEEVLVRVRRGPEVWEAEIEKDPDEDLGLAFEDMDILKCDNACVFCFLHQMPRGMRKALYYQDDDYRLSFLHGAYVTLTNLSEEEFQRIIDQRLSPVYISVHATDPDLRGQLLGRRGPDDVIPRIRRLAASGIQMHTQVVLCPGLNDGERLKRTVFDLARWRPHVESVGIVPLGLTRYRKNLPQLDPVTPDLARHYIAQVEGWRPRLHRRFRTHFVYLSDEFYLMTGSPIPPPDYYDGFPLVENGVGMVRRFLDLFDERVGDLRRPSGPARITLVTSVLAGGFLPGLVDRLSRVAGLEVGLCVVQNRFFGDGITVSGLLTGADIRDALRASPPGDIALLPPNCVSYEGLFLDDLRPADLERDLRVRVVVGTYDLVESVERALREGGDLHAGRGRRPGYHPYISAGQYA
ncbi:MAG: hypothetical protein A3F84_16885 [Candidatus Handelsmanbacteria bacterium RIFCSPLOWO2_12_FULL_64_10]|uniref:PDZ domain-containing protein n=1 Tax=Handelsmanbacteria sp. (strain RIFCSPLOWO2_12_FULL_64_10) TaxID=1817868 RepID=A0A1F6CCZ8_HANXR|nr:MAG: hypothetical protein A3F84_16885 [Candidatus Handelsmanbacteria bacterium RIFCSPLOWO2_12_FULL_64_10]